MASKRTFTLDDETAARIDRTAVRLGTSRSRVVREAVREYAARVGQLSDDERRRLLGVFDDLVSRIPTRPAAQADREIAAVRRARRAGSRRTPPPS
ncbi:MAG TPA: ribbon-helix-helix protein, CopG family [Gemmatimonadales bacterium]